MRDYKLVFLLNPETKKEEVKKLEEKFKNFVKEMGGKAENFEIEGKKKLAYKIKKVNEAILGNFQFSLEPQKTIDFEKKLKSEREILRYMLVKEKREKIKVEKPKKIKREKVELAEIEKKLEEILDESK